MYRKTKLVQASFIATAPTTLHGWQSMSIQAWPNPMLSMIQNALKRLLLSLITVTSISATRGLSHSNRSQSIWCKWARRGRILLYLKIQLKQCALSALKVVVRFIVIADDMVVTLTASYTPCKRNLVSPSMCNGKDLITLKFSHKTFLFSGILMHNDVMNLSQISQLRIPRIITILWNENIATCNQTLL